MNIYRRKILVFLAFCLVFQANLLFADEKTVVLGGSEGWPEFSVSSGVETGKGRFGKTCIQLATNSREITPFTDLLIDFESSNVEDRTGNYTVTSNSLIPTKNSVMGKQSGMSRGNGRGLTLKGKNASLFGTEGSPGSFAIEFWLCPSIAENGEVIFEWKSSRIINGYITYQSIIAAFINNRIEWSFTNIFDGYKDEEVIVKSYVAVIPDKWAHHIFSYNEESGLVEYLINGNAEALRFVTSTDHERGTINQPVLGLPSEINICPQFTGCIDDLRIIRSFVSDDGVSGSEKVSGKSYDMFKTTGGYFITKPIAVSPGSVLQNIEVIESLPDQTDVRYYVRSGENFYGWTANSPEWVPMSPGREIKGVKGRFFQVKVEMFPDGQGRISPNLTELKLNFREPPLPLPPLNVRAKAGNGEVTVSWEYSVDDTAGGYYIYYGTRPGEYLGAVAVEGSSPIKLGNVTSITLTGLENGRIYYFALATYSNLDTQIVGNFSKEVYARPGR